MLTSQLQDGLLEIIARLLVSLAASARGVGTAADHASPDGHAKAIVAIEAIIARVSAAVVEAQAAVGEQRDATGLERATDVADEHAADGLVKAAAGPDNAVAAAAEAPDVDAPPVDTPPVDVPAASGPPATHPPVPAPRCPRRRLTLRAKATARSQGSAPDSNGALTSAVAQHLDGRSQGAAPTS